MIKLLEDVGAPATVIAVDIATMELAPQANEWVSYGLTALGYIAALFGFGGNYVKNLGVTSLPLTARNIYARIRTPVARRAASTNRLVLQHNADAGGPLRRSYQPEFESVAPHAF